MAGRPQDVWMLMNLAAKEATYDASTAVGAAWYKLNGPGLIHTTQAEDTDQDEITGHPYVADGKAFVTEQRTHGSIEFKAGVDLFAFFFIALFGNVSTSGVGPYTHVTKWPGSGVGSPFSFSFVQNTDRGQASTQHEFTGVYPASVELTIENPGSITATVELQGSGSFAADVTADPAIDSAIEGNRLKYSQLTMLFGPASQDVTTSFRRLTLRANADVRMIPLPGSGTTVGEIHYGEQAPTIEAELVLKGSRGDTFYTYWEDRTKVIFNMYVNDGTNSIRLLATATRVEGDAGDIESFDGVDHVLTLPLRFEYNSTDASPFVFTAINSVSTYLA